MRSVTTTLTFASAKQRWCARMPCELSLDRERSLATGHGSRCNTLASSTYITADIPGAADYGVIFDFDFPAMVRAAAPKLTRQAKQDSSRAYPPHPFLARSGSLRRGEATAKVL